MGLALVVGPAKAGKIARLLESYLAEIERDPVLIVPNAADVDRVERDLLRRAGALLHGSIGTFDDLFRDLALGGDGARPVVGDTQRMLVVRRALGRTSLNGLGRSARFGGFADALLTALAELESGLVDPDQLGGDLGRLYAAYRGELDRLGLWDRDLLRRRAVERVRSELSAWDGRPVFAYGFEDLTGAEWGLLEALSGRGEVTVSLPYEPGRPAFASLQRTVEDLGALADGRIEELPPRSAEYGHPALAHVERHLFADEPAPGPELEGALRFFEGAGSRGALELVAEEIRELADAGAALEEIAVVVPSLERWRAPIDTALATFGIPFAVEGRVRLAQTPFGQALLALLRFAWQQGGRRDLYAYLRSPFSGFARTNVDFLEGRLRGRGIATGASVEEETVRLRDGHPIPALESLRGAAPVAAVRALAAAMLRAAHGLESPPVGESTLPDLRAHDAIVRALDGARWLGRSGLRALARRGDRRPRAVGGAARAGGRTGARRGARPRPRPHATLRRRLRPRARAGQPAAPWRRVAVPGRRRPQRARRPCRGAPDAPRPGGARPLSLLHGLHPAAAAPLPRTRGGDRRGEPARGEPVLARGAGALRAGRRPPLDAAPAAVAAHLGLRAGTDRARAAAVACPPCRDAAGRCSGTGGRERLGAPARAGADRRSSAERS